MSCDWYDDGRHRLIVCDDELCCPRGYIEVCYCGAQLGNAGRARRAKRKVADKVVGR